MRFVTSFAGAFATPAIPGAAVADERGTARELRRIAVLPRRTRPRLLRRQGANSGGSSGASGSQAF